MGTKWLSLHMPDGDGDEDQHRLQFGAEISPLNEPGRSTAHLDEQMAHQYPFALIEYLHLSRP